MGFTWAITLESVLEQTDELDHLYELIEKRRAQVTIDEAEPHLIEEEILKFVIEPVLTALENHLRVYLVPGMQYAETKNLVHAWIDEQMDDGHPSK
jgi:hypothetical protein